MPEKGESINRVILAGKLPQHVDGALTTGVDGPGNAASKLPRAAVMVLFAVGTWVYFP